MKIQKITIRKIKILRMKQMQEIQEVLKKIRKDKIHRDSLSSKRKLLSPDNEVF